MAQLALIMALILAFLNVAMSRSALRGPGGEACAVGQGRQLATTVTSTTVCYPSAQAALVVADGAPPVENSIPGWQYTRAVDGTGKINWYFYGSTATFPYSDLQSMYAGQC